MQNAIIDYLILKDKIKYLLCQFFLTMPFVRITQELNISYPSD